VALIATGDELISPSAPLSPGKIRNSNGPALASALTRWGISTLNLGVVPDEPKALEEAFSRGLSEADVLLVSGGVSGGDFDYTRDVLAKIGVQEIFWKVAIKPGKPLFFGVGPEPRKSVFGLPGNPVSVLICLEEFVRPSLEKLQGKNGRHPSYHLKGKAINGYLTPKDRRQYLFCRVNAGPDGFDLEIIRPQGSAMLGMVVQANGLALAPMDRGRVDPGDLLPFRWLK
jgi:molybdopterin molybdotransferase